MSSLRRRLVRQLLGRRPRPGLIAVAHGRGATEEKVLRRLQRFEGPTLTSERVRYLTAEGRFMEPRPGFHPPAHNFAALSREFSRFYMFSGAVFLTRSATSAAYVGFQLHRMGGGADVILQENPDFVRERARLSIDELREYLPSISAESLEVPNWFRLSAGRTLGDDLERLRSMVPRFLQAFPVFRDAVHEAIPNHAGASSEWKATPEGRFVGQLGRLMSDGAFFGRLLPAHFGGRSLEGVDVGGGFGFLALELAASGHRSTVIDIDRVAIDIGGPTLARVCRAEDRVRYTFGSMLELDHLVGVEPRFDYVAFMGSLLLPPRHAVPGVLRSAMRLLRPGGLLVVKESPTERERGRTASPREDLFSAGELRRYLADNAGQPTFYSAFTARELPLEEAQKDVLYAVVRKA